MSQTFTVFLDGTAAVFVGMAVLYVTIRVLAAVVGRWGAREAEK